MVAHSEGKKISFVVLFFFLLGRFFSFYGHTDIFMSDNIGGFFVGGVGRRRVLADTLVVGVVGGRYNFEI